MCYFIHDTRYCCSIIGQVLYNHVTFQYHTYLFIPYLIYLFMFHNIFVLYKNKLENQWCNHSTCQDPCKHAPYMLHIQSPMSLTLYCLLAQTWQITDYLYCNNYSSHLVARSLLDLHGISQLQTDIFSSIKLQLCHAIKLSQNAIPIDQLTAILCMLY